MNELNAVSLRSDALKQRTGARRVVASIRKQNILLNRKVVGAFVTIRHRAKAHSVG
jgi:hypothetical protein